MHETISIKSIRLLVDVFYRDIRKHPRLGPVFNDAIGRSDEKWEPHLQKITHFWSSLFLGTKTYRGNPLRAHRELPQFPIELFDEWLDLFHQKAAEIFVPEICKEFKVKSEMIARSLKVGIYQMSNF
ncbi:MAG: group III truncated hemoglobin [Deltaproteobacteria bacterium]|nr:group III truncated hemoglobin [Deltaproteobacteria bacterium]